MLIVVQADMLISKFCILPLFKCDSTHYSSAGEKMYTFNCFIKKKQKKHPQICLSPHEYSWEDLNLLFSYVTDISDHNINTEYAEIKEDVA